MDPKIQSELSKLSGDGIPFRASTSHLHHTWANTFYSRPELYIQPESVPEIQKAVNLARRCRRRVVVVGNGHSPSDLTCTSSWMINLDNFDKINSLDKSTDSVTFESGVSLHNLGLELAKYGLSVPNLGSIDVQSVAGAISTGTHGSSLHQGLLSQSVTSISLILSNGQLVSCSATSNLPLFRAALLSLGSLGIIVSLTFTAVPDFNIAWSQSLHPLSSLLDTWDSSLWSSAHYTRVWWMPYLSRAVIWSADRTDAPAKPPLTTWYGGRVGFLIYHNLLALAGWVPSILPFVEWFIFGMQYGFSATGKPSMSAVQPAREGLLMDCLYSQFVNEWALPLSKGPEAIIRLGAWINGTGDRGGIPYSSRGVWVHCPIEVRVSDTSSINPRPFLDPTYANGPTLYLNATLYRPYGRDPPCRARYYEAFQWLMQDLGARPHWAKNFEVGASEVRGMYGGDLEEFLRVREEVDPEGMFLGAWHREKLLGSTTEQELRLLEEPKKGRRRAGRARGDGLMWIGAPNLAAKGGVGEKQRGLLVMTEAKGGESETGSPPSSVTATSDDSFDYLAKGEASVHE